MGLIPTSRHFHTLSRSKLSECEIQWDGPTTETVPTSRQVLLRCCWAPWRFTAIFTPRCFNMSTCSNPAGDDWHFITALIYTVRGSQSALTYQDRLIAVTLRDQVRGAPWLRSGTTRQETHLCCSSAPIGCAVSTFSWNLPRAFPVGQGRVKLLHLKKAPTWRNFINSKK